VNILTKSLPIEQFISGLLRGSSFKISFRNPAKPCERFWNKRL